MNGLSPVNFYRAMRMHSTDFVVEICLSVYLSDTRRYCVEMGKRIIKLFYCRVATPFQFFRANFNAIFRRGSPNGGDECSGGARSFFLPGHNRGTIISNGARLTVAPRLL